MRCRTAGVLVTCLILCVGSPPELSARQGLPLEPVRPSGQAVSPVFEGWYQNPDGTYTLSFGYINRNSEEVLDVPVGEANRVEPGGPDRGQPSHFLPRRHYGVYTVTVPEDFGSGRVMWTLDIRGERFAIPGRLAAGYEIDALGAPATGINPPTLWLESEGPEGRGPGGVSAGPIEAARGVPLELQVRALDDEDRQVTLRWAKYSGPGAVSFDRVVVPVPREDGADGHAVARATFSEAGEYVVLVQAHNTGVASAGHAQCCWTNGYVRVHVAPEDDF